MSAPELPRPSINESILPSFVEHFPTPEDWIALQGGKPRVFRHPVPNKRWIVLHVYDEHSDAKKRFQSGAIVDTVPRTRQQLADSLLRLAFTRPNEDGERVERDIAVPSFMLLSLHGGACEIRSGQLGGDLLRRVTNQIQYEAVLDSLIEQSYIELRYGVDSSGFKLFQLPTIRPARPLATA